MATEQQYVCPAQVRFLSSHPSPSEVSLVPYAKLEVLWTVPEHIVRAVARQCMEEDTFRTVFYDGPIKDEDSFLAMMQSPSNAPVFAFRGEQIIGFAWLNGIAGCHAFGHFCFLKQAWGEAALEAGQMILEYWLSFPKADGTPLLQVIIGSVPVTNTLAIAFVHNIGFKRAGQIPKMLHNDYTGENVTAAILYYVRP